MRMLPALAIFFAACVEQRPATVLPASAGCPAGCERHDGECLCGSGSTCPTGSTLTYANFGNDWMRTYCLDCHSAARQGADRRGAPPGSDYDTLDRVRANAA